MLVLLRAFCRAHGVQAGLGRTGVHGRVAGAHNSVPLTAKWVWFCEGQKA